MEIDAQNDKIIATDFAGNIILPTPGGTPEPLVSSEIYISSGNTWIGPWLTPVSKEYKIVRIGNQVSLQIDAFVTLGDGFPVGSISSTFPIPDRFLPTLYPYIPIFLQSNSLQYTGVFSFNIVGDLDSGIIFLSIPSIAISGPGYCGPQVIFVSWSI